MDFFGGVRRAEDKTGDVGLAGRDGRLIIVILRRLSIIGDALSHASLAGVATGLILNFNPVLGAIATAVIGALGIEFK